MTITHLQDDSVSSLGATVARRVRGLLAEQGRKQEALAPILGISPSGASKRVRGLQKFDIDELPAVAEALDTSVEYLLGLTNDRSPRRAAAGGGSFFVLPERSAGLLRACRDSNPKPSDLVLWVRRLVAMLGSLLSGDRTDVEASGQRGGEESGAVIIGFPLDRVSRPGDVEDRIQAGEWPDDFDPEPPPPAGQARHLKAVS